MEKYVKVYYFMERKEGQVIHGLCMGYMNIDTTDLETVKRSFENHFDGANFKVGSYRDGCDIVQIFAD